MVVKVVGFGVVVESLAIVVVVVVVIGFVHVAFCGGLRCCRREDPICLFGVVGGWGVAGIGSGLVCEGMAMVGRTATVNLEERKRSMRREWRLSHRNRRGRLVSRWGRLHTWSFCATSFYSAQGQQFDRRIGRRAARQRSLPVGLG